MSQENVEIVSDSLEALADGGLDTLAEFWTPDINWRAIEGAPDDVGEMHGREAARRYVQDWFDTFDNFTVASEELLDVGDDRVVAVQYLTGRARLSGVETEFRYAVVYTLREGRIFRVKEYRDREAALAALGLDAEGASPGS
jgi:ketosteroid isomerase-like protein